jgi:hypothetical protein
MISHPRWSERNAVMLYRLSGLRDLVAGKYGHVYRADRQPQGDSFGDAPKQQDVKNNSSGCCQATAYHFEG